MEKKNPSKMLFPPYNLGTTNKNSRFGEQFSQAIKVVTEVCLTVLCSLEKMQKTWTDYDLTSSKEDLIMQKCGMLELFFS